MLRSPNEVQAFVGHLGVGQAALTSFCSEGSPRKATLKVELHHACLGEDLGKAGVWRGPPPASIKQVEAWIPDIGPLSLRIRNSGLKASFFASSFAAFCARTSSPPAIFLVLS